MPKNTKPRSVVFEPPKVKRNNKNTGWGVKKRKNQEFSECSDCVARLSQHDWVRLELTHVFSFTFSSCLPSHVCTVYMYLIFVFTQVTSGPIDSLTHDDWLLHYMVVSES